MDTTASGDAPSAAEAPRSLSVFQRAVAIYTRPARAWDGLDRQTQWWFPVLIFLLISVGSGLLLYDRAILPMQQEQMSRQVANGQMDAQQAERAEQMMTNPVARVIGLCFQVVSVFLIVLFTALMIWFGVGFVLGTGMKYRLALEVASWSLLVLIPAQIATGILAWIKQNMHDVHVGFGILLPDADPPTKLHIALGILLDWIGPLSIWYLIILIIGASTLSGAPRPKATWTLSILYLVMGAFVAGLAALFTPT